MLKKAHRIVCGVILILLLSGCTLKIPDSVYKKDTALVIYAEGMSTTHHDEKTYNAFLHTYWKKGATGTTGNLLYFNGVHQVYMLPSNGTCDQYYNVAVVAPGDYTLKSLHYSDMEYTYTITGGSAASFSVKGGDIVYLGELSVKHYKKGKKEHYELKVIDNFDNCITKNKDILPKGYDKTEKRLFTINEPEIVIEDF